MRVLGLDQSFTKSGIVILDNDEMVHFELYKTDKKEDIYKRTWDITQHVKNLSRTQKIDVVSIEGLAYAMKGNATRDLAGLQFSIITTLRYIENIRVEIIPPNTVKKIATGKGNAKKEKLLECLPKDIHKRFLDFGVRKTTGITDLTDAYWIAKSFLALKNN